MKIYGIYLIDKIITGGNKRYIELMNGFAEKGHTVSVFVNSKFKKEFNSCITIPIKIKFKKYKRVSKQINKELKKHLNKNEFGKVDYIIVFGETNFFTVQTLNNYTNSNIIFCYRSDIIEANKLILKNEKIKFKKKIYIKLKVFLTMYREKFISKKSIYIIFQTENDKNNFIKRNPIAKNKCKIIRNDILRPRFTENLKNKNTSNQCKNILFVGEYNERKGFRFFLQALIILKKKNITFNCGVIARNNCPDHFLEKIKNNNLQESITFLPQTNKVMEKMLNYDLVVVPSLFDSYPNVIMESIHTGTPVIATNTSGMPYMLGNQELLFETANSNSIANKIEKCIIDNQYYLSLKKLCQNRRSFFEFDWIDEWCKILNEEDIR